MVWAAIGKNGKSQVVFVEGNLNAQAYTEMIANYLLQLLKNNHGGENCQAIFEQENAPAHSALHTKDWFFDNLSPCSRLAG